MKKQTLIADIYTDQPLNIPEKGEKIGDLKINYPDYNVVVTFYVSKTKVNTYKVVSKPILLVTIPVFNGGAKSNTDRIYLKNVINTDLNNEYNVLVIFGGEPEIKFQVFTEADQKPIDYEGLEKIINESLKTSKA